VFFAAPCTRLERLVIPSDAESRCLLRDLRGVVFLEFLIAFIPVWSFSLCIFQLALIARANLIVKHSADAAARSAAVVLPDDPAEYGGEPEMSIGRNRLNGSDLVSALGGILSDLRSPSLGTVPTAFSGRALANVGRSRLNTIRLAAHVPLIPLAPLNVGTDPQPSLRKALGGARSLVSGLYYQPFAVAVTFPDATGAMVTGPEVKVRVTYAYQCTVPLARQVLCAPFGQLKSTSEWAQSFLSIAQRFVGGRFRELQHESTALIHSAPYTYKARSS
jgi:Flp pilus assembly protein TadG